VRKIALVLALTAAAAMRLEAQGSSAGSEMSQQIDSNHAMHHMRGDDHDMINMQSDSLLQLIEHHATAGTDAEPNSTPGNMIMTIKRDWMLMFHGVAFLADTQQTGPRGRDKFFSTNWIMPMAQRSLGQGTLTFRTMLSFEPATISQRRYPLLFQKGETAFGKPIVDGQEGVVLEFSNYYWMNFMAFEPEIQISPQSGVVGGKEHRHSIQTLRKFFFQAFRNPWRCSERDAALPE